MKFAILFATVLAVSSAQFPFGQQSRAQGRFPVPSPPPIPRPSAVPVVNRVATNDQAANIIRYDSDINPDGSFNYGFDTDNGISVQAQGTPRDYGGNPPLVPVIITGGYSYTSPEGQPISISYIADENGYQPQGDSLPTPPPIPEAIARALEYIARNPPAPKKK